MYPQMFALLGCPGLDHATCRRHDLCLSSAEDRMLIGESFVGEGAEAAQVNTVLGDRDGPVGAADSVSEGIIDPAGASTLLLIAAVWVNPAASDAGLVYANNRAATREALRAARDGTPSIDDVLAARFQPTNPYYTAPPAGRSTHPGPASRPVA
jgi:formaldehyde-activating enzyme involved in methanogenesis